MTTIADYTKEELEEELEKRNRKITAPKLLQTIDITSLQTMCEDYIDSIIDGDYHEESDLIFEIVMECFYGKNIWDWIEDHI